METASDIVGAVHLLLERMARSARNAISAMGSRRPPPPPPPPFAGGGAVAATTVNAIAAFRLIPPPLALMVTEVGPPASAPPAALKVTVVELPETEAGLNVAVTPAGKPLAVKSILFAKLVRAIVTEVAALAPWVTEVELAIVKVKSGTAALAGDTMICRIE